MQFAQQLAQPIPHDLHPQAKQDEGRKAKEDHCAGLYLTLALALALAVVLGGIGELALARDAASRYRRRIPCQERSDRRDNVRQAHSAGVRIVAGTDSGDTYGFPGFAIHDELAELVRAGLTPADALRSATIDAARFSGKAQAFGSIESGKVADMVLLDANPLTDIRSTGKIAGLFFNGQYLDRAALDGLLAFAEDQAGGLRTNLQLLWGALRSPVVWAQAAD